MDNTKYTSVRRRVALGLASAIALALPVATSSGVHAASEYDPPVKFSVGATKTIKAYRSEWVAPTRLTGTYSEKLIAGVSAYYLGGGATISVADHGAASLRWGFPSWTNQSHISFTGTLEDVNKVFSSISVNAGSATTGNLDFYVTPETPEYEYNPAQSRYYRYVKSPGITWDAALAEAATKTFRGQPGHLATPSTESENDFISRSIYGADNAWIAATDRDNEGEFKWAAGAEAGTTFWKATCASATAGSVDSCTGANTTDSFGSYSAATTASSTLTNFSSWAAQEPNNWHRTSENYVATNWQGSSGMWNDLPNSTPSIGGYIVEYPNTPGQAFVGVLTANQKIEVVAEDSLLAPRSVKVKTTANPGEYVVTFDAPKAFTTLKYALKSRLYFSEYTVRTNNSIDGGCVIKQLAKRQCVFSGFPVWAKPEFLVVATYSRTLDGKTNGQRTFGTGAEGTTSKYPSFIHWSGGVGSRLKSGSWVMLYSSQRLQPSSAWSLTLGSSTTVLRSGTASIEGLITSAPMLYLPAFTATSGRQRTTVVFNATLSDGSKVSYPYSLLSDGNVIIGIKNLLTVPELQKSGRGYSLTDAFKPVTLTAVG